MKRYSSMRTSRPISLLSQILLILGIVVLVSLGFFWITASLNNQVTVGPSQVNILELWNNGSYDEILANGQEEFKRLPLDPGTLVFSGFAAFHKGVTEVSVEKKLNLINQAIVSLRKALLLSNVPLQPEIHYILGKAYFHKGKFYTDLTIRHLLISRELGYNATDMNEYLGLAYSLVGRFSEASEFFLKAVEKTPSDLLLWTLGQTYFQMQKFEDSIQYLRKSIAKTKDRALEQRCRFLLGEIYTKTKQYSLAQSEYLVILDKNPNSADAHYYLGEIASGQGNKEVARAEWRKTFKIDPLHWGANQRLFN